jgi:two-component system, response regulator PdtaR
VEKHSVELELPISQVAYTRMEKEMPTVLVVDDEPLIRLYACGVLEEAGYPTKEAGDAEEAMRILADGRITILIADIEMPGSMGGLALARRVRETWPHIAVIVASGQRLPLPDELPEQSEFLAKPFSRERLLGLLAHAGRDVA